MVERDTTGSGDILYEDRELQLTEVNGRLMYWGMADITRQRFVRFNVSIIFLSKCLKQTHCCKNVLQLHGSSTDLSLLGKGFTCRVAGDCCGLCGDPQMVRILSEPGILCTSQ